MSDYEFYAIKAAEMRELAKRAASPSTQAEFERLATEYEKLATAAWPQAATDAPRQPKDEAH